MAIQIIQLDQLGFAPGGERLVPVLEAAGARVLLLSLEAGQSVDPCRMTRPVLYLVLEGRGRISVEGEEAELLPSSLVTVAQDVERCIYGETALQVLAVQLPSARQ